MPTTFTSLRSKGAAYVGGLLTAAAAVAITGALTGTTANFTSYGSGATLYAGGGTQTINVSGTRFTTMEADTVSGATIRTTAGTVKISDTFGMSGASLMVNRATAGTGTAAIRGTLGGRLCMLDRAGAAYTVCATTTGTMSCRVAQAAECP